MEDMYSDLNLNEDSEDILMYMKDSLSIDSDVFIFELDETDDHLTYVKDGQTYLQLFPIDHAVDLIEFDLDLKDKGYSNKAIAERLLEYRINDA